MLADCFGKKDLTPIVYSGRRSNYLNWSTYMLVTSIELLIPAMREAYAIGAFNISNLESLLAIKDAADEERSPAIIAVSPSSIRYVGLSYIEKIAKTAASSTHAPMALHLDHGKDEKTVTDCLAAGFTSIMIDGSHLEFGKNIALTKRVVDLAHGKEASVEAELGRISSVETSKGEEREAILTDPDSAEEFVVRTGVDMLAVAIGTSHGAYKFAGEPKLDFERLRLVRDKVSVPLVLHGASSVPQWIIKKAVKYGAQLPGARGIPEAQIKEAISLGISKVNIDTDLRLAFTASVREYLVEAPREFDPRKILGTAREAMRDVVKEKMHLFGSSGRELPC